MFRIVEKSSLFIFTEAMTLKKEQMTCDSFLTGFRDMVQQYGFQHCIREQSIDVVFKGKDFLTYLDQKYLEIEFIRLAEVAYGEHLEYQELSTSEEHLFKKQVLATMMEYLHQLAESTEKQLNSKLE